MSKPKDDSWKAQLDERLRAIEERLARLEGPAAAPSSDDVQADEPESTGAVHSVQKLLARKGKPVAHDADAERSAETEPRTAGVDVSSAEDAAKKSGEGGAPAKSKVTIQFDEAPTDDDGSSDLAGAPPPEKPKLPSFEELVGGRLMTWIGGGVLVVALAFFIPYAWTQFDTPAWLKVTALHGLGVGILFGALYLFRKGLKVASQSVAGLGLFALYGTAYASLNIFDVYQEWFGGGAPTAAFLECCAITVLAVVVSLRMNAVGVIILGALCGYLTPWLTSSEQADAEGLFTYVAF